MALISASGDLGPPDPPQNATERKEDRGKFVYRILRKGETPWKMRQCPDTTVFSKQELRATLLSCLACGNQPQWTSIFLHCTGSLSTVTRIFGERRRLYSHWLVRWPKFATCGGKPASYIDFDSNVHRVQWLSEEDYDNDLSEEAVRICRKYVTKDKEVIFLQNPDDHLIDVWDEEALMWKSIREVLPDEESAAATSQPSDRQQDFGLQDDISFYFRLHMCVSFVLAASEKNYRTFD